MPGHLAADQRTVDPPTADQQVDDRPAKEPCRWRSLVRSARQGDEAALGEICERLRPQLLQLAHRNLAKDLTAKIAASDIVQTSLLEAVDDFDQFVGDNESEFRAWVQRIVSNNLIDVARLYRNSEKRCTAREIPIDAVEPNNKLIDHCRTASSIVRQREADVELLRFVTRLPERRRQVIEWRFRDGMSHAEIAGHLQISEVAARKTLSRAIEQLRSMLAGQEDVVRPNQPR